METKRFSRGWARAALVVASLAALACWPAGSEAARAWTTTQLAPGTWAGMAVGAGETVVATLDPVRWDEESRQALHVFVLRADGSRTGPEQISPDVYDAEIEGDAQGGAILTWNARVAYSGRLMVATRPPGGRFGAPRDFGRVIEYDVATNRRGEAILFMRRYDASRDAYALVAARRAPGGEFGEPYAVAAPVPVVPGGALSVALTAGGDAVYAWQTLGASGRPTVLAQVERAGESARPAQVVSAPAAHARTPRVLAEPDGEGVLVAWVELAREQDSQGPARASVLGSTGLFGAGFALGGDANEWQAVRGEIAEGGEALLAWVHSPQAARSGGRGPARVASVDMASGSVSSRHDVSLVDVDPSLRIDVAADGDAVVALEDDRSQQLRVARRVDGHWDAAENVFCPYPSARLFATHLDASGRSTVLWLQAWWMRALDGLVVSRDEDASAPSPGPCPRPRPDVSISPDPAVTGSPVTFDASNLRDPDAVRVTYRWGGFGSGMPEFSTGSDPIVRLVFDNPFRSGFYVTVEQANAEGETYTVTREMIFEVHPGPPASGGAEPVRGHDVAIAPRVLLGWTPRPGGGWSGGFVAGWQPGLKAPASIRLARLLRSGLAVSALAVADEPLRLALRVGRRATIARARVVGQSGRSHSVRLRPSRAG
ncbi:MAG: hypothetical protein M3141_04700, partial [Actinomycetota bacterium]|nr:hypothetical protein [Actinomycetota bacterium]